VDGPRGDDRKRREIPSRLRRRSFAVAGRSRKEVPGVGENFSFSLWGRRASLRGLLDSSDVLSRPRRAGEPRWASRPYRGSDGGRSAP
jgi:hypothetical protein